MKKLQDNPREKLWYICGPPGMVDDLKEILLEINVAEEKIKFEDWKIPGKHSKLFII